MVINLVAVGNSDEAFVEKNLSTGLNIISSDDNNKGKTIMVQSMMYALGNEPFFPTSFNYKDYYYYVKFTEKDIVYELCRYKDSYLLRFNSKIIPFESVSELKRYWTKHIFSLPEITKDQVKTIVDPVLFLQLFFVGQDKKDTSNIAHPGYYKKQDYYEMIFSFCDAAGVDLDESEIVRLRTLIKKLKDDKSTILKQHKILKKESCPISYLSTVNDRISFEKKINEMETIRQRIEELRKERNTLKTRQAKWKTTHKELNSINRTIDCGELRCMDCNSTHIAFSATRKKSYTFDISTTEMRNEIISSIQEKISAFGEEIERINREINKSQKELQELMSDETITLESIVAFKQDVFNAADAEARIVEIDDQLQEAQNKINSASVTTQNNRDKQNRIMDSIVQTMNSIYKRIDPEGNITFDDIFTKRNQIYSGSEETIFHLVKLFALRYVLNHPFPIVIDSFRAEDLSTQKEQTVLDIYKSIPNQVIFTTTLKNQELGKYDNIEYINHIDYTSHTPFKVLSEEYLEDFKQIIAGLSFKI